MALDREDTLKKAEKLLRQGRLDAAIAEYLRVVEDQPRDWNMANTLGDLYARAGQLDKAAVQYGRIADHFMDAGFYPKAAALYKKILKIAPDDETSQLHLAELSSRQGLLVDAKSYLTAIASRRRARGDRAGAAEIILRLGSIDPLDFDARLTAARAAEEMGDQPGAALMYGGLYADLLERGRPADALDALNQAIRLNPQDREGRATLAKAALSAGDFEGARGFLDPETAGDDPALLVALLDVELRAGQLEQAREMLPQLLTRDPSVRDRVIDLAWSLCSGNPDDAFVCVDAVVDASIAAAEFAEAAGVLQEFVTRTRAHIPALLKLVEVCVDGGLESTMYDTQAQLTDAYLEAGQAAEARVIAEDLVAREPWEATHIDRFRRALVLLRVFDPDSVIAERLSGGQAPFTATDHFVDVPPSTTAAEPEPAPAEVPATPLPQVPPAPPPAPAFPVHEDIDLTGALGDLEGMHEAAPPRENLDDVFKDLRDDSSRHSSTDQSAQHMKLAHTYLEMGLVDEAIAALKTAVRSPRQRFEAASILGRLYRKRSEHADAVHWFERAAEAPAPTIEEGRSLMYDFGVGLEETGETARALAIFMELQADAGEYRDVAARVDRLSKVQTGG
ncbi:MAG: tetratricopeptide repeat protein [Acidobacteria bacterium]|nr:tetratricopeptide repeat protein [Acidobacteriota bacterium]